MVLGFDPVASADASARAPEITTTPGVVAALRWRLDPPRLVVSSAPVGGGIGLRRWILNAQVAGDYARTDLDAHVGQLARALDCTGPGVGMLTAKDVTRVRSSADGGVECFATVGVRVPTWAAAEDGARSAPTAPGTINLVAFVPVRLASEALVNAVVTATEAKAQALLEAGVPGTGTASDAICICCPSDGEAERFAGPRSVWGARLARAAHAAVGAGLVGDDS